MDISNIYFYLIYLIILFGFFTIVRDRKLFPPGSSRMLALLTSITAFFASYLFIRSLVDADRYGSGTCGPGGCAYDQPLIFFIDEILFILMLPLLLFTTASVLFIMLANIRDLKIEMFLFDGASIIFAGSLLFLNFILGGNPALKIMSPAFLMVTLVLLMANRRYRHILVAAAASYIVPLLYW